MPEQRASNDPLSLCWTRR